MKNTNVTRWQENAREFLNATAECGGFDQETIGAGRLAWFQFADMPTCLLPQRQSTKIKHCQKWE